MNNACHSMDRGEILNLTQDDYPLYHALFYGSKVETAKFSKRVSCSIKHLPIRVAFDYEYNTIKAVEAGISKDPTLVLDGAIFIEGLAQAEEIKEAFLKLPLKTALTNNRK